jgi:hypothetical protein
MFHPVGPQPPSVYWRRRLLLLTSLVILVVLLVMTVKVITSGGDDPAGAQGSPTTPHTTSAPRTTPATSARHSSPSKGRASSSHSASSAARSSHTTTPPPPACRASDLAVTAVAGKDSYHVGDQPLLELQVTNTGGGACVQDLADKQIELKVYNGESRVWGSHDCKVQPGTDNRTLAPDQPVRVAITWSGLSSRPGCAGTRQRVGAGTYTLYALLSGKTGRATQFTIG